MALTEAISAQTTETTSDAITLDGPTEIIADGLQSGDYVEIQRETVAGSWVTAHTGSGPIRLEPGRDQIIYEGYSQIKLYKPVTNGSVAVGYAQS